MSHPSQQPLSDVLEEFYASAVEPTADHIAEFVNRYPQYATEIGEFAALWLVTPEATDTDFEQAAVSETEADLLQSRLVNTLHDLRASDGLPASDAELQTTLSALATIKGAKVTMDVARRLNLVDAPGVVVDLVGGGIIDPPRRYVRLLAERFAVSVDALNVALQSMFAPTPVHFSASVKPHTAQRRTWVEVVEELPVSDERKRELLDAANSE